MLTNLAEGANMIAPSSMENLHAVSFRELTATTTYQDGSTLTGTIYGATLEVLSPTVFKLTTHGVTEPYDDAGLVETVGTTHCSSATSMALDGARTVFSGTSV